MLHVLKVVVVIFNVVFEADKKGEVPNIIIAAICRTSRESVLELLFSRDIHDAEAPKVQRQPQMK